MLYLDVKNEWSDLHILNAYAKIARRKLACEDGRCGYNSEALQFKVRDMMLHDLKQLNKFYSKMGEAYDN